MRWFTMIYPREEEIKACLDGIIFLANPNEKDAAHITIRGPSATRSGVKEIAKKIVGAKISVLGTGRFFEGRQNTVFLRCGADEIRQYWNKPDYEFSFNPHLTLYDGPSREFAERLLELLNRHKLFFSFSVGECKAIGSTPGQKSMHLLLGLDQAKLWDMTGEKIEGAAVHAWPEWQRLTYIERICTRLNWIARPTSVTSVQLRGRDIAPTGKWAAKSRASARRAHRRDIS